MDRWKSRGGKSQRRKEKKREDQSRERVRNIVFFQWFEFPKVLRPWCALYILTSKGASRHNGVHFFDISASKSGPNVRCLWLFDFEMCFAPQRRAIFHLSSGHMALHPTALRALFDPPEPGMSKKCTPLWREAHLEFKMYKAHQLRSSKHFWKLTDRQVARQMDG